ncbi:MAG: hypothetical protein JWM27_1004 [Gemmatimonadetes bacterium]|nr:hypothetical protein [Gemmatimonadota bacterium]
MSELIVKCGNALTQHVQMVFPEGGLAKLSKSGIGIAYKAVGAGGAGSVLSAAMDASLAVSRKLHGGMLFPGSVLVYSDKVVFEPAFRFLSGLYEGIESVTIPANSIRDVELTTKFLVLSTIDLHLTSGDHVRIVATAEAKKMTNAIKSIL